MEAYREQERRRLEVRYERVNVVLRRVVKSKLSKTKGNSWIEFLTVKRQIAAVHSVLFQVCSVI